jgi:hypothetical protein
LVAVGIGASLLQGLDRNKSASTTASSQGASSADQRLALQPPTVPSPSASPTLGPVPLTALPSLPPGGTAAVPGTTAPIAPPPTSGTGAGTGAGTGTNSSTSDKPVGTITNVPVPPTGAPQPAPAGISLKDLPRGADTIGSGTPVKPLPGSSTLEKQRALEQQQSANQAAGTMGELRRSAEPDPPPPAAADFTKAAARAQESPSLDLAQEVKTAFSQSWKAPADLTETVQYRVEVAADGTLQSITPFNTPARTRSDLTAKLPAVGTKLTAPLKGGSGVALQVFLEPNGEVRALSEN